MENMDWQGVATLITAIGTIIALFLNFRQHTYNKEKEYELKKREERDSERRNEERKEIKRASQTIYRELNRVFHDTDALRAYIVQPHPLDKAKYISVQYEVLGEGLTSIVERVHRLPIGSVGAFVAELSSRDFVMWATQSDVKDGRARAMMHDFGADKMAAMRMMQDDVWLGNLVLDFDIHQPLDAVYLKSKMGEATNAIKYVLPEIEED